MEWKSWLYQALVVIVTVVLVLALLQVFQARTRIDLPSTLARPFYPSRPPMDGSGDGVSA